MNAGIAYSPHVGVRAIRIPQRIRRGEGPRLRVVPAVSCVVPAKVRVEFEALPERGGVDAREGEVVGPGCRQERGLAERQVLEELGVAVVADDRRSRAVRVAEDVVVTVR